MFRRHALLLFVGGILYCAPLFSSATTTIATTPSTPPNLAQGLVGHWAFDGRDLTSATATDRSGNGNDGILYSGGGVKPQSLIGHLGQAVQFPSASYIKVWPASSINDIGQLTIAYWVKPKSNSGYMLTKRQGGGGWRIRLFSGQLRIDQDFNTTDGLWQTSSNFPLNSWTHVVITYSNTSTLNDPIFYVNGIATSSSELSVPAGSAVSDVANELWMNDSAVPLNAPLDDVRVYNRILSATEIKQLYNLGQAKLSTTPPNSPKTAGGLVGWWTFDGKDVDWRTNKVLDRSGLGNHGAIINMATATAGKPGKIGQGMRFLSTFSVGDSMIQVGSPASLDNLSGLTAVGWARPLSGGENGQSMLFYKASGGSGTNGWYLRLTPYNIDFFVDYDTQNLSLGTTTQLLSRDWHHVAVTWDGGASIANANIYLDGVSTSASGVGGVGNRVDDSGSSFSIGNNTALSRTFDGLIDDVRIYNRILTPQEIKDLYNQTKGSTVGKCGPGPVLDADGNKYSIVQIGTQCWLDRNMNVGTRINSVTAQTNNATIEKYCYDDILSNCTDNHPKRPDGGLYQWDEAMQYSTTEGARGICPAGWHIPTNSEWNTLENFLKTSGSSCDSGRSGGGCAPAGSKLRPGAITSFEANWAGYVTLSHFGSLRNLGGYYWSSTDANSTRMFDSASTIWRQYYDPLRGHSVRCIKN